MGRAGCQGCAHRYLDRLSKRPGAKVPGHLLDDAMATITKDTKAPSDAAKEVPLVRMMKNDEVLYVHPTCVAAHVKAGWKVKD